jgi:hypothetical protein
MKTNKMRSKRYIQGRENIYKENIKNHKKKLNLYNIKHGEE